MARGKLKPIDTTTLHERAYQHLKQALMAGLFKPGEVVTLRGVSDALGTSVMPVREAVRRLVSERALEMPSSRSIRVPLMSRQRYEQLCRVRMLLEGEAAAAAAVCMTQADIVKLRKLNARFVAGLQSGNAVASLAANQEFHFHVYRAAENPLLMSIIESLWLQGGPYLSLMTSHEGSAAVMQMNFEDHERLMDALEKNRPAAARKALVADITDGAKIYIDLISRFPEPTIEPASPRTRSASKGYAPD